MKTNFHSSPPMLHTPRGRHIAEAILAGVAIVIVALGLSYWLSQRAAPAPTPALVSAQAMPDPSTQGALTYIAAHQALVVPALAADAASQGSLGYIAAHQAIPAHAPAVDPNAQSVLDYLRQHGR